MTVCLFLHALDQTMLGRPDPRNLPEQLQMELLIQNFDGICVFQERSGDFRPVHQWVGLRFGDDGSVRRIDWNNALDVAFGDEIDCGPLSPGGAINFRWIPEKVERFGVARMGLSGTIETAQLPQGLLELYFPENRVKGPFALGSLPLQIVVVDASKNLLDGSLDMRALPRQVQRLHLSGNAFSGSVELSTLPETLAELNLSSNRLSGKVDLSSLPTSLHKLWLRHNHFEQDIVRVGHVPSRMSVEWKNFGSVLRLSGEAFPLP